MNAVTPFKTTIVGITGTLAQFNAACTDADFAPIDSPSFTTLVNVLSSINSAVANVLIVDNSGNSQNGIGAGIKFRGTGGSNEQNQDCGRIYSSATAGGHTGDQIILQVATAADTWANALTVTVSGIKNATCYQSTSSTTANAATFTNLTGNGIGVGIKFMAPDGSNVVRTSGRIYSNMNGSYTVGRVVLQTPTAEDTWVDALTAMNGNVGIGVNPTYKLDVLGTNSATLPAARVAVPGNGYGAVNAILSLHQTYQPGVSTGIAGIFEINATAGSNGYMALRMYNDGGSLSDASGTNSLAFWNTGQLGTTGKIQGPTLQGLHVLPAQLDNPPTFQMAHIGMLADVASLYRPMLGFGFDYNAGTALGYAARFDVKSTASSVGVVRLGFYSTTIGTDHDTYNQAGTYIYFKDGNMGIGREPIAKFEVVEASNATQTTFTQAVTAAGMHIVSNYTNNNYTPGLFWSTSDNTSTKPKAGIYLKTTSTGSQMIFGTSNDYGTGITNSAITIDQSGTVSASGAVVVTGSGQFKGYSYTAFTGPGVEVGYTGGTGIVVAFDRTAATYLPLSLQGSIINVDGSVLSVSGGNLQVKAVGATNLTGSGVELAYSSGNGIVQAYNRDSSVYRPLQLIGSTLALQTGAVDAVTVDASQNTAFAGSVKISSSGTAITKVLSATATLDFGNTSTQNSTDLTITVTGAAVGDSVIVVPPAAPDANTSFTGWVSAADTVTVRFNNYSSGSVNPASGTYRATVIKF